MIGSLGWNRTNDQRINRALRESARVIARQTSRNNSGSCETGRVTLGNPRSRSYRTNFGQILAAFLMAALAGCSTLTLETGLSQQVSGIVRYRLDNGEKVTHQPRARIALYVEPRLTATVTATVGVEHLSFPNTDYDRGEERAYVAVRWRPFTKAP